MRTIVVRNIPEIDYVCLLEVADDAGLHVEEYFSQLIHEWVQPEAVTARKSLDNARHKLDSLARE